VLPGAVTYLGHATTVIEIDGVKLLTDPLLRNRIAHLRRYAPAPVIDGLAPDAVLVSHAHRDHLDLPSLRAVSRDCPVIAPRGCGRLAGGSAGEVIEVDVGGRVRVKTLEVEAISAKHDGRRNPLGRPTPALGYHVAGSLRVYFAGDTDLFPEMAALAGGLDLALLPVAGWGPKLGPGHLDPERAARAAALLRPRIAVPIHWGTLAPPGGRPADPEAPAREFERQAACRAPEVDVRILSPGERLHLAGAS
jgi:L-ascorbate metabolism protein UlaG (beta-lactamase superfamily)